MADAGDDDDLFADLYDDNTEDAAPAQLKTEPLASIEQPEPLQATAPSGIKTEVRQQSDGSIAQPQAMDATTNYQGGDFNDSRPEERPIGTKEDGKMFIGGLNWETTDQSLKDYFSQFGEVVECTVMRDGATGRSRGFGFLTFRDPKTVNTVMVKEHQLDGKLIDPKRAIPRDEQERTAKIFVGGVSQDATEADFKDFFMKFGRVLDATLMMDKDTGRPRGFGFVTFDSDMAVERTLEGPLAILGKPIEVKRAQPRGKMEEEGPSHRGFGRGGGGRGWNNHSNTQGGYGANSNQMMPAENTNSNAMTPAMAAQFMQRMQQWYSMAQANMMGGAGMNPMVMQQMQMLQQNPGMAQMMAARNPQQMMLQMQQMQQMQQAQQAQQQAQGPQTPGSNGDGSPAPQAGQGSGFSAQEQLMFEQSKYERQQMARMQMAQQGGTWDGMYDDVPAPAGMPGGGMRGGFGGRGRGRGGGGGGMGGGPPANAPNAPAGAPTGPKNAGIPGANYRGGGRGGRRGGFQPYPRRDGA